MMFRRMFVFAARLLQVFTGQNLTWSRRHERNPSQALIPGDSVDEIFLKII
jgi:hypothetical protein